MARETWKKKGLEGGIRRKKVLTGMPSLVKAAERQREQREVSVTPCHTRQRTVESSEGHWAAKTGKRFSCEAQAEPWELRQSQLSWEAHAKQQPSRAMGEPFLTWLGSGRGGEEGHDTNTDNRERGWARQQDPTGSCRERQHG